MVNDSHEQASEAVGRLRARVVIAAASGAAEQLTYAVPAALADHLSVGHRVVVPLRARRVTGIVVEVGTELDAGGGVPRPIFEVLEARPLFDAAHLELIKFLGSYYMTTLGEAFRNVIPATARVESRRVIHPGALPSPLAAAALSPLEARILTALQRRPRAQRELRKLGATPAEAKMVDAAVTRLIADGLAESRESIRGRHREGLAQVVRLVSVTQMVGVAGQAYGGRPRRGGVQRVIIDRLATAGAAGLTSTLLEDEMPRARSALRRLIEQGVVQSVEPNGAACPPASVTESPLVLTPAQDSATSTISPAIRERRFESFLLWGITGSGKTEVYVRLAAEALQAGRQVVVLVPEIALADQLVRAFRERFGPLAAIVHSAQNVAERWAGWMAALGGESRVIIGPRSAIFVPLHDVGLIVVDEEHDSAYKQEEGVRYNARDLAVMLGRLSNCPVVLGSATPSAESYTNARRGRYRLLRMMERVGERKLPEIEVLDLRDHLTARAPGAPAADNGNESDASVPLAPLLVESLRTNLAAAGQSMIFLNRRGYHNFLQCQLCGNVIACPNCSVSLTFHLRDRSLRCHYCGANTAAPEKCSECGGWGLQGQGFGTERLTETLTQLLPGARIERMDSDTSGHRGARTAIVDGLRRGSIDIVVGTQMITKGFDFPGVTLVGVVLADMTLNMPDFRSAERTFQLLTQVAGRAGRGERPGRVIIQTYAPHHYSIRAAHAQDYSRFMRRELELRRELNYPPFGRMALVRIEGPDAARVSDVANRVAAVLARIDRPDALRVLGPAPAPIERLRGRLRWQVVVKSPRLDALRAALIAMRSQVDTEARRAQVRVAIDLDPVNML